MIVSTLEAEQLWYVAFTQPNAETRAIIHLENQGFHTYLPRFLKRKKYGRTMARRPVPLFPRYVFVGIDVQRQRWRSVNGTVGVSHLICHGDIPAAIDSRIVETLQAREDESGFVRLNSTRQFKPGQAVRITEGVFADQLGLYVGLGDQERVRILLNLLGQKVKVLIETESIAAA